MPLPQKAIEQLGREPAKTPGWSPRVMMVTATILIASFLAYFGFRFGYKPYLEGQLEDLNGQIKTFSQQVPAEKQEQIVDFYSQLSNLQTLLASQPGTSQLFTWLEANTQANVSFNSFSLSYDNDQLTLRGEGRTVGDIAEQVRVFESKPEVIRAEVSGASLANDGFWSFGMTLTFSPSFLIKPQVTAN